MPKYLYQTNRDRLFLKKGQAAYELIKESWHPEGDV